MLNRYGYMKISKALIEKYHNGDCSADEKRAVEEWLFNEDESEQLSLPEGEDKLAHRAEMWHGISSVLQSDTQAELSLPEKKSFTRPLWWQAVAAAMFLVATGFALRHFLGKSAGHSDIVVMNNTSETANRNLQSKNYTISVGPKSNVEINNQTGVVDFCGAMMILPKEDIEFTIQGTCANPSGNTEKMVLKKGLNYFALNYNSSSKANEVIIMQEGAMTGLPPLVLKQLLRQFNI